MRKNYRNRGKTGEGCGQRPMTGDSRKKTSSTHRAQEKEEENHHFLKCAHLILPWLPPSSLASISSTCKTLHSISTTITTTRASDASQNMETNPIPFLNPTLNSQPYSYFLYTPHQLLSSPSSQPWGGSVPTPIPSANPFSVGTSDSGCGCENFCDGETQCPCSRLERTGLGLGLDFGMMTECGPGCVCGLECGNRFTQRGVSVRLKIVKDGRKGWGLFAGQFVPRGEFICEYAGELLTTEEARRRQQKYDELASTGQFSSALLVVREHLPSGKACLRMNIDATRIGNIARFINHSCDGGNLSTVLVRNSGALLPRLCFFASRNILEDEELAFSYGEVRLRAHGLRCYCGSSNCFGALPSEQT